LQALTHDSTADPANPQARSDQVGKDGSTYTPARWRAHPHLCSVSLAHGAAAEGARAGRIDGWILKPIDFRRLQAILCGVTDLVQRSLDEYRIGCSREIGRWLQAALWLPASMSASVLSANGAGLPSGAAAAKDGDHTPDTNTLHET
jgi:hypothetical protein